MSAIKDWIMKLAGVMVLCSVCEIVMPSGEMKKYIRFVVGLVTVLVVTSPVANLSKFDAFREFPEFRETMSSRDIYEKTGTHDREEIIRLYREKLCENMKKELESGGIEGTLRVDAEIFGNEGERFGQIVSVKVTAYEISVDTDLIYKILKREFGVSADRVGVVFGEKTKE